MQEEGKGKRKVHSTMISVLKQLQVQDISPEKQAFQAAKGANKKQQKIDQGTWLFACRFGRVSHLFYLHSMSC